MVLNYCLQGLFHPSRKVREVYWKIYNSLYIGSQEVVVVAYPVLEDEKNNIYSRPELVMFIQGAVVGACKKKKTAVFCLSIEVDLLNLPRNFCFVCLV